MPKFELKKKFLCPISHEKMLDPVVCSDGHTYDRRSIEKWFSTGKKTSPFTNQPLQTIDLFPNHLLRSDLAEFLQDHSICQESEFLAAVKSGDLGAVKKLNFLDTYLDLHDPTPDVNKFHNNTPLHFAAITNNLPLLKFLVEEGANLHSLNHNGEIPVRSAARCGCLDGVRYLLEVSTNPTDVEAVNFENCSSLANASYNGYLEVVKLLVGKGADVENKNKSQIRPLMWAAMQGRIEVIKYLLTLKPELDAKDKDGDTALHFAVKYRKEKAVELLIGAKAALDEYNNMAETPLISSINGEDSNIPLLLIQGGASVHLRDKNNNTPLMLAVKRGKIQVVRELVKRSDLETMDPQGETPLTWGIKNNQPDIAKILIEAGANPGREINGLNAFHCAVKTGLLGIVSLILENESVDVDVKTISGSSALHLAAAAGNKEMIVLLMRNGASHWLTNIHQETPADVAQSVEISTFIVDLQQKLKKERVRLSSRVQALEKQVQQQGEEINDLRESIKDLKQLVNALAGK